VRSSAETHATSSPSMDISKASNFERFVHDLLGRDGARVRALFEGEIAARGMFALQPPEAARIAQFGFSSGRSTHADRIAAMRRTWQQDGRIIDTHTADGVHVARHHVEEGVPMIVFETALPAKFADSVREAIGILPPRPAALHDLESRPRHCVELPADVRRVQDYIAQHARPVDG
jgi:threonine synthase